MRRLQTSVYRVSADRTIQLYGKYDAWRQRGSMPVSVSVLASVEGADNFQERYAPAVGAVVGRSFGNRASAYATPVWVHNTAALLGEDRDTFFVGVGGFRSKLWMYDPSTGDYAGLYDWDDPRRARAYAEGLSAVLRLVSVPGTVSYELVPGEDVATYLATTSSAPSASSNRQAG